MMKRIILCLALVFGFFDQSIAQTVVTSPTLPQFGVNRQTGQLCHKLLGGQCFEFGIQDQTTGLFTLDAGSLPPAASLTAAVNPCVGDTGSGGIKGLVPAPAAGDAAAGKFLGANCTWQIPANASSQCVNAHTQFSANGTAGDGIRIQNAITAAETANGGPGCVYFPAIGAPYYIDTGISVPGGVALIGVGTQNYAGLTASVAQWAQNGTWFQCVDASNPCVSVPGHGVLVNGVNFIWNQVIPPSTGTYTPTAFPWGIYITGTFFRIRNLLMVGGSHCIDINYNSLSGGGTYSDLSSLKLGCLVRNITITNANDDIYTNDIDFRPLWYVTYTPVLNYILSNTVGFDFQYTDNPFIAKTQCLFLAYCMYFENNTVQGNTHSLYNGTITNLQCNLVILCMATATNSTTVSFQASNVFAQQYTSGGTTAALFNLSTDNIDASFSDLRVQGAGGSIMSIGSGGNGRIGIGTISAGSNIGGVNVWGWGTNASTSCGFNVAANASIGIGSYHSYSGASGAFTCGTGGQHLGVSY